MSDAQSPSANETAACLFCGRSELRLFLDRCRDYYMGKPGEFDYFRCGNCGLIQLNPVPPDMSVFYEAYQVHSKKSWLHETMRSRLMSRGYYLPDSAEPRLRVLDFGCGDGWYLRSMHERGHDVAGFEAAPAHAAELSRHLGVPVFGDVETLKRERAGQFDVVTMHFVVEHLSDLAGTFALAYSLLKPGGRFYFMVPNIKSMEARLFRRKWHGLDPPRHIQFLTPELSEQLATRTGFTTYKVEYFSLPNGFAGSLSTVFAGRFVYPLFAALMLPSLVACAFVRDGNLAITLAKPATANQ
jgi:SAM-dependent methyltransferase